jgi:diaminopimelate decarboxylase
MALAEPRSDTLYIEDVSLVDIAEQFGTPCYVYSRKALTEAYTAYRDALAGRSSLICYAVKANSNLAILNLFARLGAGFDIVSGGELARVLTAGGESSKVVFSGVGKSRAEIATALRAGIKCFNIESATELDRINAVAGDLKIVAAVSFRVNPDVDPKTHPYISTGLKSSKFGIAYDDALPLYRRAAALPHIRVTGIDCHIGSQLLDPAPAAEAAQKVLALVDVLTSEGISLDHIDVGGGMGICYNDEIAPSAAEYLAPILRTLAGRSETLMVEPGRSLVGNAGLLLTRVEILKHGSAHDFAIVDAAMNDLMRPALYDAWHNIVPVLNRNEPPKLCEVVGPVCESGDFLGHDRMLAVHEGDLLAILSAGAYGMTMSSNYNTRPRAAEVMVDGDQLHLIRKREEISQLFAGESTLP